MKTRSFILVVLAIGLLAFTTNALADDLCTQTGIGFARLVGMHVLKKHEINYGQYWVDEYVWNRVNIDHKIVSLQVLSSSTYCANGAEDKTWFFAEIYSYSSGKKIAEMYSPYHYKFY